MRISTEPAVRLLLLLTWIAAGNAAAQVHGDEGISLTLRQAVAKALANHPGIEAARVDANIESSRRDTFAQGTPYRLDGIVENVAGSGELSGFDASETTVFLSKTLETGDKSGLRRQLGDTRVERANVEIALREADVAAEVSRRYVRLLQLQETADLFEASVAISRRTLDVVKRRVAIGRASEAEESYAAVSLARARLDSSRVDFEIVAARASLSSLWGTTNPGFAQAHGDFYVLPEVPAWERLRERLPASPAMRRLAAEAVVRNAEQRVALSRQSADIELSAGLRHLAATDDVAMILGVSVPFGSKSRAAPLVRASDAGIARLAVDREWESLQLESALRALYQDLLAARNAMRILQSQVIPEAQRAVTFYERGFETGSYSLLEVTAAQERLVAVRRDAVDAAAALHLALIEIESLLGSTNPGGALL